MTNDAENKDQFCDRHSILKIRQQINELDNNTNKLAFLVLSGSFNPVHTQHINALVLTKRYLESLKWSVVGGFLAPSSDDHVRKKLNAQALLLRRRIELCKLSIEGFDWLNVCMKGEFSSKWACWKIRTELEDQCFQVLNGRRLTGMEIMGSDSFVRIFDKILKENDDTKRERFQQPRMICCLPRPGFNDTSQRKHIQNVIMPSLADLGVGLISPHPKNLDFPLKEVSSSSILELVSNGYWETLQSKGWLHLNVLKALQTKE